MGLFASEPGVAEAACTTCTNQAGPHCPVGKPLTVDGLCEREGWFFFRDVASGRLPMVHWMSLHT